MAESPWFVLFLCVSVSSLPELSAIATRRCCFDGEESGTLGSDFRERRGTASASSSHKGSHVDRINEVPDLFYLFPDGPIAGK